MKFRGNISKDLEKGACGVVVAFRVVTMSRPSGWGEHQLAGISSANLNQCSLRLPDVSYREVLFIPLAVSPFKPRPQLKSDGNVGVVHD